MKHLSLRAEATTPTASRDHPFEVDDADHCETPFAAYRGRRAFSVCVALALRKPKEKLRIYDPYFCEGSVAKHLARLGFTSVHNENEDFYAVIEEGRVPEHDVLLTNPPYSGDHFRKILEFAGAAESRGCCCSPTSCAAKRTTSRAWASRTTVSRRRREREKGETKRRIEALGRKGKPLFLIPDPARPYRYWAPGAPTRIGAKARRRSRRSGTCTSAGCARTRTCARGG